VVAGAPQEHEQDHDPVALVAPEGEPDQPDGEGRRSDGAEPDLRQEEERAAEQRHQEAGQLPRELEHAPGLRRDVERVVEEVVERGLEDAAGNAQRRHHHREEGELAAEIARRGRRDRLRFGN
jgi:hypothetical protein